MGQSSRCHAGRGLGLVAGGCLSAVSCHFLERILGLPILPVGARGIGARRSAVAASLSDDLELATTRTRPRTLIRSIPSLLHGQRCRGGRHGHGLAL
uniref:Uncharacterized protein n=1 Tax=Oryza sativa subsp. japonica TaxID=39947 RepID=Q6ZAG6_ORYSJ|nr:hypothetical protein [Oryza sativa Japonica Group]BAD09779.1 hypothetical protein [Oryza sativa Japonica Group]